MRSINLTWLNSSAKRKVIRFGGETNNAENKNAKEEINNPKYDTQTTENCESKLRYQSGTRSSETEINSDGGNKSDHQCLEQRVNPIWHKIAKAIKYHRYILKASLKDCAEEANMSISSWRNYENEVYASQAEPSIKQIRALEKIATALTINYSDLLKDYPSKIDGVNFQKVMKKQRWWCRQG